MTTTTEKGDIGMIVPSHLYNFKAIERLMGIGRAGISEARKQGLEVRYFGRHGFVLGKHLIDHILKHGRANRNH